VDEQTFGRRNGKSVPQSVAPEATLTVACLITAAGGFLDAFTYVGHGHVFANAMTGNVVLMGVAGARGDWAQALRHIPPIVAFLLGIITAHLLARPHPQAAPRNPLMACMGLEAVFLFAAAWLPQSFPDLWLVLGIAFTAALQQSSFPKVRDYAYTSVMTTGNLRQMADGAMQAFYSADRGPGLRRARTFGLVCACFLIGAAIGARCTMQLGNRALLVPAAVLGLTLLGIRRRLRGG
jgi:uncharacterized membrane protein YoaK (UPF0700 family)